MRRKFTKSLKKDYGRTDIRRDLRQVYGGRDGRLPDMSRLIKKRTHRFRNVVVFLVLALAFLAFVSWAGFAVFNKGGSSKAGVKLAIEAPKETASGAEIIYLIKYENLEPTAMKKAEFSVYYPEGFIFTGAAPEPQNETKTVWPLGSVAKGGHGEIEIRGRLIGEIGEERTLNGVFAYWPENFNSQFQVSQAATVKINSSVISLTIEGPKQILNDQDVEYSVKYQNESDGDLSDWRLKLYYPEGFEFAGAQPKAEPRDEETRHLDDIWLIDKIAKGESGEIKIKGKLTVAGRQQLILRVAAEMKGEDGEYFLQQAKELATKVLSAYVNLKLAINGASDQIAAGLGDILNYSLIVQNVSDQELSDLTIKADFQPAELLDWTTIEVESAGGQNGKVNPSADGGQIVWTAKEVPELGGLIGGAEIALSWQIKINKIASEKSGLKIDNYADLSIGRWGEEPADFNLKSNLVSVKLNSDVELLAAIRYFNDDNIAVGSGPLPPRVGETTTYRVYWRLVNTLHELSDVKISAVLPDYVNWTGKTNFPKGDIGYNSANQEVVWSLNRLPINLKEAQGDFEIAFAPISDFAGKIIILLPNIKLEATDSATGGKISKVIGSLTTDLTDDPGAQGKGLVAD